MPTICKTCQMKFNCPEYSRSIISENAYWDLECKAEECKEKERIETLKKQIKKGCDKCSQWDEYYGCCKCE